MLRVTILIVAVVSSALLLEGCGSGGGGGGGGSGDAATMYSIEQFAAGDRPHGLAAADVDGDGRDDLIAASRSDDGMSILIGDGDGSFVAAAPHAAGHSPADVVAVDVDGDEILDLVSISIDDVYTIAASLGNGDGTFGVPQFTDIPVQPFFGMAAGDINGDGLADIAMPHISFALFGQIASVFLSNGDGTFTAAPHDFAHPQDFQSEVDLADLDGDGNLDLVVNVFFDTVFVYFGNGDGTFQPQQALPVEWPFAVTLADVDDDGIGDVLVASGANDVYTFISNGDRTFQAPIIQTTDGNVFYFMETALLNDDEFPDVVWHSDEFLGVLLGRGDGTFEDAGAYLVGNASNEIAFLDADRDGNLDIAMTDGGEDAIKLFLGYGDGTFYARPFTWLPDNSSITQATLGDVDGDGVLDLITFDERTQFWRGDGAGRFSFVTTIELEHYDPSALYPANLNGDDLLDLVTLTDEGVDAYLGDGNGGFEQTLDLVSAEVGSTAALGLLNSDNILDIVYPVADEVVVLLGTGNGTFGAPTHYPALEVEHSEKTVVDDFDGDGRADVVTCGDEYVYLLLGNGDGTLEESVAVINLDDSVEDLISSDLDRDGFPEIIYTPDSSSVTIAWNRGDGTFGPRTSYQTPDDTELGDLEAADLDGDDRLDIIALGEEDEEGEGSLFALLNNGDGTLQEYQVYRFANSETFDVGDFDNDQRPDFVAIHEGESDEGIVTLLHR